jgi:glycerol kinase
MQKYILSLDQGTTSSRAIIFNKKGQILAISQAEFEQIYPQPGWVEHDPEAIWQSQQNVILEAQKEVSLKSEQIAAIGITNQRETTLIWNKETGKPIYNAIVWQDKRTAKMCDEYKKLGYEKLVKRKTGLVIDSYFSATKVKWILDNVKGAREKAGQGKLAMGTVDSWLIWKLTNGEKHITDVTNASRSMLYNISNLQWDQELLQIFNIPAKILPEVVSSSGLHAETKIDLFDAPIPIAGIAGDQQAALFGQQCISPGLAKSTYGTGSFLLMNTGEKLVPSKNKLVTTIAWQVGENVQYALEGSIFIAGAVVQWLRDQLGIIQSSSEIEALAASVEDNGGVYFVPAFAGLGAPHWDQYARGTIVGLTRGTGKAHLARAALEGIAFQAMDIVKAMEDDSGIEMKELRADGGAAVNNLLMQFQAEVLQKAVVRPQVIETTALGAAYLAGLAVGYWQNMDELQQNWQIDKKFEPKMAIDNVKELIVNWEKALNKSRDWVDGD